MGDYFKYSIYRGKGVQMQLLTTEPKYQVGHLSINFPLGPLFNEKKRCIRQNMVNIETVGYKFSGPFLLKFYMSLGIRAAGATVKFRTIPCL